MNKKISDIGWNIDNTYAGLSAIFYHKQGANKFTNPKFIVLNRKLALDLGLDPEKLDSETGLKILSASLKVDGAISLAQAYAGHQYGNLTMLGDGRALLLFEHITPLLEKYDIQLKGSGRTKYSRNGDGLASLSSMLREYIISEAMSVLNIESTRCLAVMDTNQTILRERNLKGGLLVRVSKAHIRVGTFQFAISHNSSLLKELADYTIDRLYPEALSANNPYLELLRIVTSKQAKLIAQWQSVGFIHGVMNTDNMSIAGETIDYGPCAFMNIYDPKTVFSSIDRHGRYSYDNQAKVANWNIARFAETLLTIIHKDIKVSIKLAEEVVNSFQDIYDFHYMNIMKSKLGIFDNDENDEKLISELLQIMKENKLDYTNTFLKLTTFDFENTFYSPITELTHWTDSWINRLTTQKQSIEESVKLMKKTNPRIIARNHQVELALSSATERNDYGPLNDLLEALGKTFDYNDNEIKYTLPPENNDIGYRTYCGT